MNNRSITFENIGSTMSEILESLGEIKSSLKAKMNNAESDEILTRNQVSELLGVSLTTVHTYVNEGILKPYKIKSKTFFRKDEVLETLFNSNTGARC